MRLPHPVDGELVLIASACFQVGADFIGQVERIAENRKRYIPFPEQCEDIPKPAVQDWVTTRNVEIRQPFHAAAHFHAVVHYLPCPLIRHLHQLGMPFGEDVTVLATLVAAVGDVPLKSEIFHIIYFVV